MGISHQLPRGFLLPLLFLLTCFLTVAQCALRTTIAHGQERTGSESAPSPTPQRSSPLPELQLKNRSLLRKVFAFLSCDAAKRTKEQELYRTGQQFPESYIDNNFSLVALVKGKWAVAVEYEAEAGADATITFRVKDVEPFTQVLPSYVDPTSPSTSPAGPTMKVFRLPERFGENPQAALISFKAVIHKPGGDIPANFQFVGLGIGDEEPEPTSRNQQLTEMNILKVQASSQGVEALYGFKGGPLRANPTFDPIKPVRIASVNVAPSSLTPADDFQYSFVSTGKFGKWGSALHKNTLVRINGKLTPGTVRLPPIAKYNERVSVGRNPASPETKRWTIKKGRFTPGEYKIGVSAQATANEGSNSGKSASKISPVVRIK